MLYSPPITLFYGEEVICENQLEPIATAVGSVGLAIATWLIPLISPQFISPFNRS